MTGIYSKTRINAGFIISLRAGKTSISRQLLEKESELTLSVSATTRKRRPGETDSKDYHFTDVESFQIQINQNAF